MQLFICISVDSWMFILYILQRSITLLLNLFQFQIGSSFSQILCPFEYSHYGVLLLFFLSVFCLVTLTFCHCKMLPAHPDASCLRPGIIIHFSGGQFSFIGKWHLKARSGHQACSLSFSSLSPPLPPLFHSFCLRFIYLFIGCGGSPLLYMGFL